MIVHLFNPRLSVSQDHIGLCGGEGRTMSHHELARGKINCDRCLKIWSDNLKDHGTGYSSYREKRAAEDHKKEYMHKRKWKKKVTVRSKIVLRKRRKAWKM